MKFQVKNVLKEQFFSLFKEEPVRLDNDFLNGIWNKIFSFYTQPFRHYHNLFHLYKMLTFSLHYEEKIKDPLAYFLALFYHDIIHHPEALNNEDLSAFSLARDFEGRLSQNSIHKASLLILATKEHCCNLLDEEGKLFLCSDLAVLASSFPAYLEYTKKVRKEFSMFSKEVYAQKRIFVLERFLKKEKIFCCSFIEKNSEIQAKENLLKEVSLLKSGEYFKLYEKEEETIKTL